MKFILFLFFLLSLPHLLPKVTHTLTLPNGLKVLLISDPTLSTSGLSLQVSVGSSYEPPSIPGIAHLLEHMLHMRSKKYPLEGFYKHNLALHKGICNAMTSDITTTYYFTINEPEYAPFDKISDIFAHFFIDPIIEPENVNREINAVNNEYENDLVSNGWRFQELLRDLANENSSFRHFTIGNSEKLDVKKFDITRELQVFFEKYYSSHIMTLVIYSHHNIEDLLKIANNFIEIPNKIEKWTFPKHLEFLRKNKAKTPKKFMAFPKNLRNRMAIYEPIGDLNTLSIIFPLQNNFVKLNNKISKPVDFLIQLLKFKGKNGLFDVLKKKKLISSFSVNNLEKFVNLNLLVLKFELNTKVFNKKIEVLREVFNFIRNLKKSVKLSIFKKIGLRNYLEGVYSKNRDFQDELFEYMRVFKHFGLFLYFFAAINPNEIL